MPDQSILDIYGAMSIHYKILPSGLRVVTEEIREVDTVALGIWAAVGTRHEKIEHNGVAHMVEHMLFKGTATRSAQDIAEQVENVGGHMNAYTSREITSYHIHLLKEDFRLGMDILADMLQHSVMPEIEVERERQVILQEIGMTYDTPDDFVFDLYQQTAYPDQALGLPVLGNPEIISSMERQPIQDYISDNYSAENLVISVSGNVSHEEVEQMAEEYFRYLPEGKKKNHHAASYQGGEIRVDRELEQAHIVLGFQGIPRTSPNYQSALILSTMLGGGMSSRLFQEVREKRGLVYSVFSLHSAYTDSGQMEIYAGTGPDSLPELIPVLCGEIARFAESITEDELARAKAQRKALLLMSRESTMNRADRHAKQVIHTGEPFDTERELKDLEEIDISCLNALAEKIFSSSPTIAALGPLSKLTLYDSICEKLAA